MLENRLSRESFPIAISACDEQKASRLADEFLHGVHEFFVFPFMSVSKGIKIFPCIGFLLGFPLRLSFSYPLLGCTSGAFVCFVFSMAVISPLQTSLPGTCASASCCSWRDCS